MKFKKKSNFATVKVLISFENSRKFYYTEQK